MDGGEMGERVTMSLSTVTNRFAVMKHITIFLVSFTVVVVLTFLRPHDSNNNNNTFTILPANTHPVLEHHDALTKIMYPVDLSNTIEFFPWTSKPLPAPYFDFNDEENASPQIKLILTSAKRTFGHASLTSCETGKINSATTQLERVTWNPHGIGSALLSFLADIMNVMLLRPHSAFAVVDSPIIHRPLQSMFLDMFAFKYASNSTCHTLPTICTRDATQCESLTEKGESYPYLWLLQQNNLTVFHSLRVALIRRLFQMRIEPYRHLNTTFNAIFPAANSSQVLSLHIRRGDKIRGEATFTHAVEYVNAFRKTRMTSIPSHVILLTDDANVVQELTDVLPISWREKLISRISTGRPELAPQGNLAQRLFLDLLVDIRLAIASTWFCGTQTSNLSNLICLLRGAHECFNAEEGSGQWDVKKDKISR